MKKVLRGKVSGRLLVEDMTPELPIPYTIS